MEIYLGLVILVLILSFLSLYFKGENERKNFILFAFGGVLMVVYTFRSYSVGRDIMNYYEIYQGMDAHALFDASWIWIEWGYVLFMKVFSMMGLSFRTFLGVNYLLILIPLFVFIRRYSRDVTLSLIIFICFQFFVFSMSALRQMLAMSICLWAYLVANKNGISGFLGFITLIVIATLIHRSAVVFAPAYLLMRWKFSLKMIVLYAFFVVGVVLFRDRILFAIKVTGEEVNTTYEDVLSIGSFFYFIVFIVFLSLFVVYHKTLSNHSSNSYHSFGEASPQYDQSLAYHLNLLVFCPIIQFLFEGYELMRAAMIYQVFILLVLPNLVYEFPKKIRPIIRTAIIVGMIIIFYYSTLLPNELDIIPYRLGFD